jgi:hypothetical protein
LRDVRALSCPVQRRERALGHHKQGLPPRVLEREHVAGEGVQLLHRDLDHLAPSVLERFHDRSSFGRIPDGITAEDSDSAPEGESDVGVVDGNPVGVVRVERNDPEAEPLAVLAEEAQSGTRRDGGIDRPPRPVEHHAARAFEESTLGLVMAQIDDFAQPEAFLG